MGQKLDRTMRGAYARATNSQATPLVNRSAGESHGQKIQLREVRNRVLRCTLSPFASDALWACQCSTAAGSKSVNSAWTLLQGMHHRRCAHGCAQPPAASQAVEPNSHASLRALVCTQESALSSVVGSLRALSVGHAGEQPTTSGAEGLPASTFRLASPKVVNALPLPGAQRRGEGGG